MIFPANRIFPEMNCILRLSSQIQLIFPFIFGPAVFSLCLVCDPACET